MLQAGKCHDMVSAVKGFSKAVKRIVDGKTHSRCDSSGLSKEMLVLWYDGGSRN